MKAAQTACFFIVQEAAMVDGIIDKKQIGLDKYVQVSVSMCIDVCMRVDIVIPV